jgi:hypothetical protein
MGPPPSPEVCFVRVGVGDKCDRRDRRCCLNGPQKRVGEVHEVG